MNSCVNREFQEIQPVFSCRRTRDFFGRMLVISLALHVISSVILLSPRRSALTAPPVNYIELKDFSFHEPVDAPVPLETKSAESTPDEPLATHPPATESHPETEKLQQDVKQSLANAGTAPETLHERSFGLGLTNGYFSSLAEGETLRNDIRDYYFSILREINEKWWLNNNGNFGALRGAVVQIVVARNGMIVDKTLVRSSGNPSFDRAILTTLDKANPLPPLPDDYRLNYFNAPLRFVAPLNLLAS